MANSPRKPKPKRPESEADIQRTIKEFLELHGWLVWRNNSGKVKAQNGWVTLGPKGSPDLYALRVKHYTVIGTTAGCVTSSLRKLPWLIGIECKKPGEDQSSDQTAFQRQFEEHGGQYLLARDLKDVAHLE